MTRTANPNFVKVTYHLASKLVVSMGSWILPEPEGCKNIRVSSARVPEGLRLGDCEVLFDDKGNPSLHSTVVCVTYDQPGALPTS